VDPSLLRLMEELVESLDERDSDPDGDSAESLRRGMRVRRLEAELARRLAAVAVGAVDRTGTRDEELVAVS
jgi:hypothetical protein